MALIVADRVQETSTTTGTGSFTLAGAVTGYQTFASVLATADTTYYTIADQGGVNWEVGLGTFTSPSTLARTTILSSSNAGSAVSFAAGTKSVFITYPAGRSVLSNSSGVVPVNVGGTGAATLTANNVILGNGTSAVQFVAPGTSGNVLSSNGTTWASSPNTITVGTTTITSGTSTRLLYDNAAVVGETSGITTNGTTLTLAGTTAALASVLTNAAEVTTISATAATGTIAYDVTTQSVLYYTSNASANWTVNFRASSGTSLNTAMATGQSITVAFLVTQGATAYYNNAVQVDGTSVTPKYQGGTAWSAGNASSIDIYTYTIVKTGSAAFTVFTSQTKFA